MLQSVLIGLVSNPDNPGTLSALVRVLERCNDNPESAANWILQQNYEFQCLRDEEEALARSTLAATSSSGGGGAAAAAAAATSTSSGPAVVAADAAAAPAAASTPSTAKAAPAAAPGDAASAAVPASASAAVPYDAEQSSKLWMSNVFSFENDAGDDSEEVDESVEAWLQGIRSDLVSRNLDRNTVNTMISMLRQGGDAAMGAAAMLEDQYRIPPRPSSSSGNALEAGAPQPPKLRRVRPADVLPGCVVVVAAKASTKAGGGGGKGGGGGGGGPGGGPPGGPAGAFGLSQEREWGDYSYRPPREWNAHPTEETTSWGQTAPPFGMNGMPSRQFGGYGEAATFASKKTVEPSPAAAATGATSDRQWVSSMDRCRGRWGVVIELDADADAALVSVRQTELSQSEEWWFPLSELRRPALRQLGGVCGVSRLQDVQGRYCDSLAALCAAYARALLLSLVPRLPLQSLRAVAAVDATAAGVIGLIDAVDLASAEAPVSAVLTGRYNRRLKDKVAEALADVSDKGVSLLLEHAT